MESLNNQKDTDDPTNPIVAQAISFKALELGVDLEAEQAAVPPRVLPLGFTSAYGFVKHPEYYCLEAGA